LLTRKGGTPTREHVAVEVAPQEARRLINKAWEKTCDQGANAEKTEPQKEREKSYKRPWVGEEKAFFKERSCGQPSGKKTRGIIGH